MAVKSERENMGKNSKRLVGAFIQLEHTHTHAHIHTALRTCDINYRLNRLSVFSDSLVLFPPDVIRELVCCGMPKWFNY